MCTGLLKKDHELALEPGLLDSYIDSGIPHIGIYSDCIQTRRCLWAYIIPAITETNPKALMLASCIDPKPPEQNPEGI